MTVSSGKCFLEIAASHVTVDLMGFRLLGSAGSLDGIQVKPGYSNFRFVNGLLADFDRHGIAASTANGVHIREITVSGVSNVAFRVGPSGIITDCLAIGSGQTGFELGTGAIADRCTAKSSGAVAAFVGAAAARFSNCTATGNANDGFLVSSSAVVDGCTVDGSANAGIRAEDAATGVRITNCTLRDNVFAVLANSGCLIKGNSVADGAGFQIRVMGDGNRIEGNTHHGSGDSIVTGPGQDNLVIHNWYYNTRGTGGDPTAWIVGLNNLVGPLNYGIGTINANAWANFGRK